MKQPTGCNEWDCPHNEDGKCYVNQDDCPQIQEFFRNRKALEEANADIKKLMKDKYRLLKAYRQLEDYFIIAKAEAIKEFAERLKAHAIQKIDWNEYIDIDELDNLVKEMVGDDKWVLEH